MNIQEAAKLLNGREIGDEISRSEEAIFKKHGLVAVFGYSDDIIRLSGAIDDETGCGEDDEIPLIKNGKILTENLKEKIEEVEAELGVVVMPETNILKCTGYDPWEYEIDVPFVIFNILEEGEIYSKGIVFSINDLR